MFPQDLPQGRPTRAGRRPAAFVAAAALVALTLPAAALASPESDRASRKEERQIAAFERMVDAFLVDSPNFLVQSSREANATRMDGYGLVVSFKTSLVGGNSWDGEHAWWRFWDDDDGYIVIDHDWDDDEEDDQEMKEAKKSWKERALTRQQRRYERGKEELTEFFLDHSDLLSTLKDTEWLELQASLRNAAYFRENDLRRLKMRAKMSDLRAFADGKITADAMKAKIETKES
jgi:hypothetical protein